MEIKSLNATEQNSYRIAAFFDLDGTLLPLPSLEQRFFRMLRYRRTIPARNYWAWLREATRLLPRGINAVMHANKMYLRGVQILDESDAGRSEFPAHASGHQGQGQASARSSKRASRRTMRHPRLPVPPFFPKAIDRVAWHAKQGHQIVLLSGTLEALAVIAAKALEAELSFPEIPTRIRVCATRLEEIQERWTGRIAGEAIFGKAKARATKRLAEELRFDLAHSFAYGDSANDQWLLAAVGNPVAVNPSRKLSRIARKRNWTVLCWNEKKDLTQKTRRKLSEPARLRAMCCGRCRTAKNTSNFA